MSKKSLRQQYADFLSALQLAHFPWMQWVGNIEAFEQDGRVTFRGIAVFLADDAFQLAQLHAIRIGHLRLGINPVALLHRRPQTLVAHDDGIEHAIAVKCKLVLAQHTQLFRADDSALLRLELAGQQIHEGGLACAVRSRKAVALPRREAGGYLVKQNFGAVAHGHVTYRNHSFTGTAGNCPKGGDAASLLRISRPMAGSVRIFGAGNESLSEMATMRPSAGRFRLTSASERGLWTTLGIPLMRWSALFSPHRSGPQTSSAAPR